MRSIYLHFLLVLGVVPSSANVEKAIFLGPETINVPGQHPTFQQLALPVLSPLQTSKRLNVSASFPSETLPRGLETWVLLDNLTTDQRYELRVCWSATQPASFTIDTFEVEHVWATPELISSLASFSTARQQPGGAEDGAASPLLAPKGGPDREAAMLFARIMVASDYVSHEASPSADHVDLVLVDLILDPFLANILPASLVPTVIYVVVVAAFAWVLANQIYRQLHRVSMATDKEHLGKRD